MLIGRLSRWSKAPGVEGQCGAIHNSQGGGRPGMEHSPRQIHGGSSGVTSARYGMCAQ